MSSSNIKILVILGTAREGRQSDLVSDFIVKLLSEKQGVEPELIDVREYMRPDTVVDWMEADTSTKWLTKAEEADGFVIVAPEYNATYPGELKILLDQTLIAYHRKPCGLAGVSNGQWGGTRVVEHLRPLVSRLGMVAIQPPAYFPMVKETFAEDGNPREDSLIEHTKPMLEEVAWYAEALREARKLALLKAEKTV